MTMPVHVVVVAFGASRLLDTCLAQMGDLPVIVVDNSSDASVRAAASRFQVEYVDSGANLGFAAGVNIALRRLLQGPPTDVLLINPDAQVSNSQAHALSRWMNAPGRERIAAVSPLLHDGYGISQRVMWPFPRPRRAWIEAIGLGNLKAAPDFAVGAVLLLRWNALREVGLLDERFFLYAEETDWQRRAANFGWCSSVSNEVEVQHVGGGSSVSASRRETLFHAGTETYIRKWFGSRGWWSYRLGVIIGAVLRMLVLRGPRRRQAASRAILYLREPRRAAGFTK